MAVLFPTFTNIWQRAKRLLATDTRDIWQRIEAVLEADEERYERECKVKGISPYVF